MAQSEFNREEIDCAVDVIAEALLHPGKDYHLLVCQSEAGLGGYICYGRTPMTDFSWDLYWLLTHPKFRRQKIGTLLVEAMEEQIILQHPTAIVRVETSSQEAYGAAAQFYERQRYFLSCQVPDFYRLGDDLLLFFKRLTVPKNL